MCIAGSAGVPVTAVHLYEVTGESIGTLTIPDEDNGVFSCCTFKYDGSCVFAGASNGKILLL